MEMDYCPRLETEMYYNPPYRPEGDIKNIMDGTRKALSVEKKYQIFGLKEYSERFKISSDAIWKIAEKLLSNELYMSNIILLTIEFQCKVVITEEAKNILINNKLVYPLATIINNILKIKDVGFKIKNIDVGSDPETPDWKPIIVNLDIASENFEERLTIKHKIVKSAYNELNEESRKNIYIIGAV
jgi:hypothetical protein